MNRLPETAGPFQIVTAVQRQLSEVVDVLLFARGDLPWNAPRLITIQTTAQEYARHSVMSRLDGVDFMHDTPTEMWDGLINQKGQ